MKISIDIPACVEGRRTVEVDSLNLDDMQKLIGMYMGEEMESYFAEWRGKLKSWFNAMAYDLRRIGKLDADYIEGMALHCELKKEKES